MERSQKVKGGLEKFSEEAVRMCGRDLIVVESLHDFVDFLVMDQSDVSTTCKA